VLQITTPEHKLVRDGGQIDGGGGSGSGWPLLAEVLHPGVDQHSDYGCV